LRAFPFFSLKGRIIQRLEEVKAGVQARFRPADLRDIDEFPIGDPRRTHIAGGERWRIIRIIHARDCREESHHAGTGNDRPGWIDAVKALREEGNR
jgi:hypothetical protein